jgi:hypothetical protein
MLADYVRTARIDLNPKYQRKIVWTVEKQSMLIRSLMQNIGIPQIVLNECGPANHRKFVCVDGKQRLVSVTRFIAGEIPAITDSGLAYYEKIPAGLSVVAASRSRVMTGGERWNFDARALTVDTYPDLDYDQEKNLFSLTQNGVPASPGEKLAALETPIMEFVRELHRTYYENVSHIIFDGRGEATLMFLRFVIIVQRRTCRGLATSALTAVARSPAVVSAAVRAECGVQMRRFIIAAEHDVRGMIFACMMMTVLVRYAPATPAECVAYYKIFIEHIRAKHHHISIPCLNTVADKIDAAERISREQSPPKSQ